MSRPSRSALQRLGLGALSLGIVVATFAFVLPTIADYRDVWALVQDLSWEWIALLCVATLVNLLTFAPPWMIALPGLSFGQAITVTQVSTALSIVVPGGSRPVSPPRTRCSAAGGSCHAMSLVR